MRCAGLRTPHSPPAAAAVGDPLRCYFFLEDDRDDFLEDDRDDERRDGTLPPDRRASERPMAIACLRLVTRLPERPERSWPRFISCIARSTFLPAFGPYRRPLDRRPLLLRLLP
jgi:hypothetical protein